MYTNSKVTRRKYRLKKTNSKFDYMKKTHCMAFCNTCICLEKEETTQQTGDGGYLRKVELEMERRLGFFLIAAVLTTRCNASTV